MGLPMLRVPEVTFACLRKTHPLRRWALMLVRSSYFDSFILLNILVNFALLAGSNPLATDATDPIANLATQLEAYFQAVFTLEMLAKLVAIGASQYFWDGWYLMDFVVVAPRRRRQQQGPRGPWACPCCACPR